MKICYFGGYQRDHSRNAVFLRALRQVGVEVIECQSRHPIRFLRYPILIIKYLRDCLQTDLILVASACHNYVFLGWLLAKLTGKLLAFDPFFSLYDTLVQDRQLIRAGSLRARWYWLLDKVTCTLAGKVLLDTDLHVKYFSRTFGLPDEKFCVVPVGADEAVFFSRLVSRSTGPRVIEVVYAGSFIPLHGIPCILEAAKLLEEENFHFTMIGDGQTFAESYQMAQNLSLSHVDFVGRLPREVYAEHLARADIVLGIFGTSDKSRRVIPCKVYDASAMGKAIITGDTPAIRTFFSDNGNIVLCQPNDARSLADKLRRLRDDNGLRYRIAQNAKLLFDQRFSSQMIGSMLLDCFKNILSGT